MIEVHLDVEGTSTWELKGKQGRRVAGYRSAIKNQFWKVGYSFARMGKGNKKGPSRQRWQQEKEHQGCERSGGLGCTNSLMLVQPRVEGLEEEKMGQELSTPN